VKNRLKVLRAEREWSQADVADKLGISRQSVNAIETGRYDPSLPLAFRIADLFERTIEEIFARPDGPAKCRPSPSAADPKSGLGLGGDDLRIDDEKDIKPSATSDP
jgi:putative transcriptional regulator